MSNAEAATSISVKSAMLPVAAGVAAIVLAAGCIVFIGPRPAQATPEFATQTKLPCTQCHQGATGSPLTDFGKAFQANGNKVPEKK